MGVAGFLQKDIEDDLLWGAYVPKEQLGMDLSMTKEERIALLESGRRKKNVDSDEDDELDDEDLFDDEDEFERMIREGMMMEDNKRTDRGDGGDLTSQFHKLMEEYEENAIGEVRRSS